MNHWLQKGLLGALCLAVTLAAALPASAATSVYPNGARGSNPNLDNDDGMYSTTRQLDFDFLTTLFEQFIAELVPTWESANIWQQVTHQTSPRLYGVDNNNNGIVDTDHYDMLAAIVNGGNAAAPGLASGTINTIRNNFNANRTAVQNRELTIPAVSVNYSGIGITTTVTTGNTISILFGAVTVDIPSLWSIKETPSDPGGNGVLAEAGDMFEVCMRDVLAAEMTLVPAAGTNELTHIQSFVDVFIRQFIKTALPAILAEAGNITADNSNWNASPAPVVDVTLDDNGTTIRVQITSTNMNTAITNFKNAFNCSNFTCQSGSGSLAASGNLNGDANTNAQSFAANPGNRQNFLAAEGITVPPLQFKPLPTGASGPEGFEIVLGDDEFEIVGGNGSAKAYDWETVEVPDYTYTDPPLSGVTNQPFYTYAAAPPSAQGLYHSVQVADDIWTRTLPAFPLDLTGLPPAPTVSNVTVTGPQTIRVTFSSAVASPGSTNKDNYTISGAGKGTFSSHPDLVTNLGSNQYQLTWNSPAEMQQGGNITITVSNITDAVGQPVGSPDFGTCTGCGQGTAPTITSITPQVSSPTNVASIDFLVQFSESVQGVAAANFTLGTTGSAAGTIGTPVGTGSARTVTVSGITGTGNIQLNLSAPSGIADLAGNALTATQNSSAVQVDRDPPAPPTIDLTALSDSGISDTDDYTNDTTPTFNGVTEPNVTVHIFSNLVGGVSTIIGTGTANGAGVYSITTVTLSQGTHSFIARATDGVGNTSTSDPLAVTIDTTAPPTPGSPDLASASDTGQSDTDNITNLTALNFTGSRPEPNTIIRVTSTAMGTFADTALGSGNWTVTGTGLQANTLHQVRARAIDQAGNQSGDSAPLQVQIDTVAPTISSRSPNAGATVGSLPSVSVTFTEPVTGITGANLQVNGSSATNGLLSNGAGPYQFTGYADPANGTVNVDLVTAAATDIAGNGVTPASWTYTKNNANPTITWSTIPSSFVQGGRYNSANGTLQLIAEFSEPVSGVTASDFTSTNVTISGFTQLDDSNYRITVSIPSASFNGPATVNFGAGQATAIDPPLGRTNLAAPAFTWLWDSMRPSLSFVNITNADPTNEDTIVATFQFSENVTLIDESKFGFTTDGTVAITGTNVFPVSSTLIQVEYVGVSGDGSFAPNIQGGGVRDEALNLNNFGPLAPTSITIDNTGPALTVNPLTTTNNRPALSGTVGSGGEDADLGVDVTVNGQTVTANVVGNDWNVPANVFLALPDGHYDVQASAFDFAGNQGIDNTTDELTVDANGPSITLLGGAFVSVDCGEGYIDGGFTAIDELDGDLTAQVVVDKVLGPLTPTGQHVITYTVTDSGGKTASATRTVEVLANCPLDVDVVGPTYFELEPGESVTMEISVSGNIGAYDIQWYRVQGSKADSPVGDGDETLTLTNVGAFHDADYYAIVSDAVTEAFSPIFTVNVNIQTPVAGAAGLGLMAALSALGGALALRRRK